MQDRASLDVIRQSNLERLYRRELSSDYLNIKEVGRGAYGIAYLAREKRGRKRDVILKLPNLDIKRDIDDLKTHLEEFNRSLDAEYQGMRRLDAVHCIAHVLRPGKCEINLKGECVLVPYIVQEYIRGEGLGAYLTIPTLRPRPQVKRGKFSQPNFVFRGIKNPHEYLSLASAIVQAVAKVHRHEVVHGDLWPNNILMRNGEPVIVDFGQSLLLDLSFLARSGEPLSHDYAAPERRVFNGQWSTAADIYSLGGILFFLATGDPPPPPIEDIDELKRTVCRLMKRRNPELYLANSGIADVTARCLRKNDRDRPAFAEGVLEELNVFLAGPRRTPKLDEAIRSLNRALRQLKRNPNQVFAQIASARIRSLAWQFSEMSHGLYTLSGHYENIARGMVESLSLLRKGDSYLTLSIPSFWGHAGLGINGRFLEMNKIAAQNGASIGRVFLVTPEEARSKEFHAILEAHLRIAEELKQRNPRVCITKSVALNAAQGLYTGVVKLEESERSRLDLSNFGIWCKAGKNQDVLVAPAYREKGKDVAAVRFWAPSIARKRIEIAKKHARDFIEKSTPVDEFLASLKLDPKERRKSQRKSGDERVIVDVVLKPNPAHTSFAPDTLSARIVDYSLRGISLKLATSPRTGVPKKGDVMKLVGQPPVNASWTKQLWNTDLKVKWLAMSKEPGTSTWTVGLSKQSTA